MTETDNLKSSIKTGASILKPLISWADPLALLGALAEMESSFGVTNRPRYEHAYTPGQIYYNYDQRERFIEWGAWAACSYSSFQIMYPTACELGFDSAPWQRSPGDLFDDRTAILFVCEYIKRRIVGRYEVTNPEDFGKVYNGGSLETGNASAIQYGKNFSLAAQSVVVRRGLNLI